MGSNFASNIFAFVLVLGFLIFVHEAGHFFFAKLFKVRVLIFSLGFGKRLFGFRRGDTDYRVSLIPLGGYVRMAGDTPEEVIGAIDQGDRPAGQAASGTDPGEFLSKPKWQRFLILLAGPAMNILVAVAFLAGLNMTATEVTRDFLPIIGTVAPGKPAAAAGLQMGDRIIEANGEPITTWDDFRMAISVRPGSPVRLKYLRGGQSRMTTVVPERELTNFGSTGRAGVGPFIEPEVGKVFPGSAADKAGLRTGDAIQEVNGTRIVQWWPDLDEAMEAVSKTGGTVRVLRQGSEVILRLAPQSDPAEGYPGFTPPTEVRQFGFVAAVNESVKQNVKMLNLVFVTLGRLFRAEGSVQDFSGPISIARISGEMLRTGWQAVVFLMATISLQLGVLNLLPIPVLDGGHIMILGVEGIARRDLSIKVKERIQQVGFALLAALMLVVLYNDVIQNVILMRRG